MALKDKCTLVQKKERHATEWSSKISWKYASRKNEALISK